MVKDFYDRGYDFFRGRSRRPTLRRFRKGLFKLYGPDKEQIKYLREIANDFHKRNETVKIFEVIVKFVYHEKSVYYEGIICLVDYLMTTIQPKKYFEKSIFKFRNFYYYFKNHIVNVFEVIFKSQNIRTKNLAMRMARSWYEHKIMSPDIYEKLKEMALSNLIFFY